MDGSSIWSGVLFVPDEDDDFIIQSQSHHIRPRSSFYIHTIPPFSLSPSPPLPLIATTITSANLPISAFPLYTSSSYPRQEIPLLNRLPPRLSHRLLQLVARFASRRLFLPSSFPECEIDALML